MQAEFNNGHSPAEAHEPGEPPSFETLARLERDVNDLIGALALLGVKRCGHCKQFFRSSDPGALFDCGELVCFGCIREWWSSYSGKLHVTSRDEIERKLSAWLRKYHQAEIVKEGSDKQLPPGDFQIVTTCSECRGSGKLLEGQRCRFCNGLGTVWIVVPS